MIVDTDYIKPGKGHSGSSLLVEGADLGAYQRADFLGPYSGALARSLGAATMHFRQTQKKILFRRSLSLHSTKKVFT